MIEYYSREKVHPREACVLGTFTDFRVLLLDGIGHDVKLLAGLWRLRAADALPDFVRI